MRCIAPIAFALTTIVSCPALAAPGEIAADRNPISVGRSVTLKWYFKGKRIKLSGGRFGKGTDVTGRTSVTDKPARTTKYVFDVWYDPNPTPAAGAKPEIVHVQYSTLVEVIDPKVLGLAAYHDTRGWEVQYLKGWQRHNVPLGDPANNALMFFQPEMDSVERLAVSIVPVSQVSCAALMDKVQADLPAHYDQVKVLSHTELMYENVPAILSSFTGVDQSHPSTRTQSIVLAFVRDRLGYVISARTPAAKFETRRSLLRAMVKSFLFTGRATVARVG